MKLFSHNDIFNVLVYIFKKLEINLMNDKYPKHFENIVTSVFLAIKGLVNGLEFFWQ